MINRIKFWLNKKFCKHPELQITEIIQPLIVGYLKWCPDCHYNYGAWKVKYFNQQQSLTEECSANAS